jgi:hypothetical protein
LELADWHRNYQKPGGESWTGMFQSPMATTTVGLDQRWHHLALESRQATLRTLSRVVVRQSKHFQNEAG